MGILPTFGVCARLLAVAALLVLDPLVLPTGGAGQMAQGQEVGGPSSERSTTHRDGRRFFREYERLTRGLEPKRVRSVRIMPDGASADGPRGNVWTPGSRGDFWTPSEFRQLLR
jgi:hypothetical protein